MNLFPSFMYLGDVNKTLKVSAVFVISLRLWVRFRDRLWGWDDLFVLLAGFASVVGDTFVCLSK